MSHTVVVTRIAGSDKTPRKYASTSGPTINAMRLRVRCTMQPHS